MMLNQSIEKNPDINSSDHVVKPSFVANTTVTVTVIQSNSADK